MLPTGSLVYSGVSLPIRPQLTGILPFGLEPPDPTSVDDINITTTVFLPGNQQTILLDSVDSRVINYTPTLDGRSSSGQVGPYAALTPQVDNRAVVRVVLPPDVAAFVKATPPIEGSIALLESLLSRIVNWSKDGCLVASKIIRAVYRIIGTYQYELATSSTQETVDLHIYMAILKTIFGSGARLLGGRANEATGYDTPLVQQKATNAINLVLGLDTNGKVVLPDPNTSPAGELLDAIARGVIVP